MLLLVVPAVPPTPEITLFVVRQLSNELVLQGKNALFHFISTELAGLLRTPIVMKKQKVASDEFGISNTCDKVEHRQTHLFVRGNNDERKEKENDCGKLHGAI